MTEMYPRSSRARLNEFLPYAAWTIAVLSTAGSLFFSEVMEFAPCVLCWYQRIAMYPLVIILGIGITLRDPRMKTYALPFGIAGLALAVYHNLLYYGVISQALTPCTEGVPCTEVQLEWLGFITIPLLGLGSFAALTACLLAYRKEGEISVSDA